MSRGTRPTPTALKIIRGNPGRRPLNREEPQFKAGAPIKPDWLSGYAAEQWDELVGLLNGQRVLTVADGGILLSACLCYEQLRENLAVIKSLGRTYAVEDANGNVHFKPRPECLRLENAQREYRALLIELGLTPSSRSKVKAIPEPEPSSGTQNFFT